MRVCFLSGREPSYQRNRVILKALRKTGVEVVEATSLARNYFFRYPEVLARLLLKQGYDLFFVGFFGQLLVPLLNNLSKKPIVFDAYISSFETMVFERKRLKPNSLGAKFFHFLDKRSCELSNKILLDTNEHIRYFHEEFGLDRGKFSRVFVGADDEVFFPRESKIHKNLRVLYYASFLPLHGVDCVVKACKLLEDRDIQFRIIGKGMMYPMILKLVQKLRVKNVEFVDWVPYWRLPDEIARSDICLGGPFSDIPKARRVISGKNYQIIAMKKPVILGDNPASQELFENRVNAMMCEMANPRDLADAILELEEDETLRQRIAEGGYRTFREKCTPEAIGKAILPVLKNVLVRAHELAKV